MVLALIISFLLLQVSSPLVLYIVGGAGGGGVTLPKHRSPCVTYLLKTLLCGPQLLSD